tara:strand:+ start:3318 stop:4124 length:807 start_codon:yes stop_codon:yes gene_type:complete
MTDKPLRVISLGWGVQSWTLAAMTALGEFPSVDFAIHSDTTHELAGTYAHAAKWTPWLERRGVKVVTVTANRPDVVREERGKDKGAVLVPAFTNGQSGKHLGQTQRQCTYDWKIMPQRRFIRTQIGPPKPGAVESLQGISLDEFHRMRTSDVAYIANVYPLVDARISRADCVAWLESRGLDVPPKSACSFCPYHSQAYWKRLKRAGGPDWDHAVSADEVIRDKRPGHTLYVHPHRKPLPEAVKIPEDFGAYQLEFEVEAPCDSGYCFN